jgi:transglutaminase-like putative cysteine protease
MTIRYRVRHTTTYRYSAEVTSSQSIVHMLPRSTDRQTVLSSQLECDPVASERFDDRDSFGNHRTYLLVDRPHQSWVLRCDSVVNVDDAAVPTSGGPTVDEVVSAGRSGNLPLEALEMLSPSEDVALSSSLASFAFDCFTTTTRAVDAICALTNRIFAEFAFDPSATEISTPVEAVLADRRGVCQDFAHVAIAAMRSVGVPTRYVSGYLETDPPPGAPKLIGADASHAWFSCFVPEIGWVDADPTNGYLPGDRHITVGWGRDYHDVAPSRGVVFGPPGSQELSVSVDVARW